MTAVRTSVVNRLGVNFTANECCAADLALVLAMTPIVVVKIMMRSTTNRAEFVVRNLAVVAALNRLQIFAVFVLVICDQKLPVLFKERDDVGSLSNELWYFGDLESS